MNRALLQRALDALTAARDSVSNELGGYIEHPANARVIACLQDDLAKADDSIAELRDALAVGGTPSPGEPVHQWRKRGTAQWWDGYADHEDGGGPYEARTLYTHAIPPGFVLVPAEVFDWLMGENGEFECNPSRYFRGKAPPYWWRSELRRRIAASPKASHAIPPDVQRNANRYEWLRTHEVDSYLACGRLEKLDAEIDAAMTAPKVTP